LSFFKRILRERKRKEDFFGKILSLLLKTAVFFYYIERITEKILVSLERTLREQKKTQISERIFIIGENYKN